MTGVQTCALPISHNKYETLYPRYLQHHSIAIAIIAIDEEMILETKANITLRSQLSLIMTANKSAKTQSYFLVSVIVMVVMSSLAALACQKILNWLI